MGYDSNFNLHVKGSTYEEQETVINEIENESGYHFHEKHNDGTEASASISYAHWYDYKKNCSKVAKRHPKVYIEVCRDGEDKYDNEITRFHGDCEESILGTTCWPPFRNIVLPDEQKANPFFVESESIRKQMNIATWRHVFGVILDQRLDDGSWPPAEEKLSALITIVDEIDSSDEALVREKYNENNDIIIPDRIDGFEDAKATWVRPWREAIDEISKRTADGEMSIGDALINLNICENSNSPVRGSCYIYMMQYYASLADLLARKPFWEWLVEDIEEQPTADFLESYIAD